jgi:hypothetical protein
LKAVVRASIENGVKYLASVTVLIFALFGIAYEVPEFITRLIDLYGPIAGNVLSILAIVWTMGSLLVLFDTYGTMKRLLFRKKEAKAN